MPGHPGGIQPVVVPGLTGVLEVVAGSGHTCALREDGTVWCFGAGGLSDGGFPIYQSPRQVPEVAGAVALAASSYLTCALQADGGGWCWNIRFGTEVITPWPFALPADLVPLAAPLGPPLGSGAPGE